MPFIQTTDGVDLFYRDWGDGPPVVFVHGWALGGDIWEYQLADPGAAAWRRIAYDKRGCGRSDQPGHGYDLDTLADDLARVLDGLDLQEVTLVAHSMGAAEVARYLSRHGSDRVAKAVLIAPTTPYPLQADDNPDGIPRPVFDEMAAALAADRPAYLRAAAPAFFGADGAVSPEMLDWGVGLILHASPVATLAMMRTMSEADTRADLAAFTMPTLIIHGDADQSAPIDLTGRPTAAAVAGSRLEVYEGAPHGLFITHRERLNADLYGFAREDALLPLG
jgi:non-heme chloroperoxidase